MKEACASSADSWMDTWNAVQCSQDLVLDHARLEVRPIDPIGTRRCSLAMSAAKKKSTYVVPPISIDNRKGLQETNVTLLASPGATAHFDGESTLRFYAVQQANKKSPKFGRSRKVSSKYVLKKIDIQRKI